LSNAVKFTEAADVTLVSSLELRFIASVETKFRGVKLSPLNDETLVKALPLISIGKFATLPAVNTWDNVEVGGKGGKF
jgi:hypothetical protein